MLPPQEGLLQKHGQDSNLEILRGQGWTWEGRLEGRAHSRWSHLARGVFWEIEVSVAHGHRAWPAVSGGRPAQMPRALLGLTGGEGLQHRRWTVGDMQIAGPHPPTGADPVSPG